MLKTLQYVYCTTERFVIDPEEAVELIDENTIGICAILGSTFNGEYEYAKDPNNSI
jgi:glutamate decarboxylase